MVGISGKHQQGSQGRGYEPRVNKGITRSRNHGWYRKYAHWSGATLRQAYKPQCNKGAFYFHMSLLFLFWQDEIICILY